MDAPVTWSPELAIASGIGVFATSMPSAGHQAHATKLLIPLAGPIELELVDEGRRFETALPVLIAPEIKHAVPCRNPRVTVFFDPESTGAAITAHVKAHSHDGSLQVDVGRAEPLVRAATALRGNFDQQPAFASFVDVCTRQIEWARDFKAPSLDPRIRAVVSKLVGESEHRFKLDELAAVADLSPRWLSKLFKETMGTSLRRYARWLKLADSVQLACQARGLSESAVEAGFADLPHFSRSVTELMGNAPSRVPFELGVVHEDYFATYRSSPPWARTKPAPPPADSAPPA